ncbi:serine protease, partial [Escherichia coli]|nr:serine protease [Escherichia coli]
ALAVGIMLPASAAAANPTTYTTVTYKITDEASLKAVLEQWKKQLEQFNQGTTAQKPADQTTETTKPAKPANPTPTKPSDNGSTSNNGSNNGSTAGNTGNNNSNSGSETSQSDFAAQVVKLVNAERAKAGLSALTSDALLNKVAVAKVKDMSDNNYFDHQSPTY